MSLARRLEIDANKEKRRFQQKRARKFVATLRRQITQAEQVLLNAILDAGYWVKFQSTFYSPDVLFIPDFRLALHQQKLIIEVDGKSHEYQQDYDAKRTKWMERNRNCIVIRFTNEEVVHDLPRVMEKIAAFNPKKRSEC